MFRWIPRARSLIRGLFRRADVEADMNEEFRHHIELRTEDLVREGLSWKEASRRAHVEFGHVGTHKKRARSSRGLAGFDQVRFSWIDLKLAVRMIMKHPALTAVAVFALAIGIPVGLAPVHLANAFERSLPEDDEGRVGVLRYWDPATQSQAPSNYADFLAWRDGATTVETVAAYRTSSHNVGSDLGTATPVNSAEVTATAFDILGTRPLIGRTLRPADEEVGAPNVAVIGYDLWRSRFGEDPDLVGRSIRLGSTPYVVVGVMPDRFLFPVQQQIWVPLRGEPGVPADRGLSLVVFARLAPGVSFENAAVELGVVSPRDQTGASEVDLGLQTEIVPFGIHYVGISREGIRGIAGFTFFRVLAACLLLLACANVAMLIFARTAMRFRELAVRTALGASRARIVSQIFLETLVLAVLAAGAGLLTVDWVLGKVVSALPAVERVLPYWAGLDVTGEAVVRAIAFAVASATVAGVIPAIRITGSKIQQSIQRAEAGRSGIRFGGVTGALIVADVALAVAVIGFASALSGSLRQVMQMEELVGIPAEEYLAVDVRLPTEERRTDSGEVARDRFVSRLASTQRSLLERLEAEPGVRRVTFANQLPRMDHPAGLIEVEGIDPPISRPGYYVRMAVVDIGFFEALEQPILAGREFDRIDAARDRSTVIVNTTFANEFFDGRSPIGNRIRFIYPDGTPSGDWQEIVGLVGHLGVNIVNSEGASAVYRPGAPGTIHPLKLAIHLSGPPEDFVPTLREIVEEVDPVAILGTPVQLSGVYQGDWYIMVAVSVGMALVVLILVSMAASGLYAIVSFSVSERTREIGIRSALGASRRALLLSILRRSLLQIGIGALIGLPLAARILYELRRDVSQVRSPGLAVLIACGMALAIVSVIGFFSCTIPARRVLRTEPADALRAER